MSFLSKLKGKGTGERVLKHIEVNYEAGNLYAPISGEYIPLSEVPDPAFSAGMLGDGCGIKPSQGSVYAPVNGRIVSVAETKHFIGIETENGISLLIHIGMNTVELHGKGFEMNVSEGQKVACGDLLMTFDMDFIKRKGYILTSAFVVAESKEKSLLHIEENRLYYPGDKIGTIMA